MEVPEDTIRVSHDKGINYLFTYRTKTGKVNDRSIPLPHGNWQLIGQVKDLTEEQKAGIVDNPFNDKYFKYVKDGVLRNASFDSVYTCKDVSESFSSLCEKEGIGRGWVILKQLTYSPC